MLSRLVVIGNGFDLAHGLNTKYSDFMKYLISCEQQPKAIQGGYIRLDSVRRKIKQDTVSMMQ